MAEAISVILGFLFQAPRQVFAPLFRYGFGRRHFTLVSGVITPAATVAVAIILRAALPHSITYAPLRLIPPFGADPKFQAMIHGSESGLHSPETPLFFLFGLLVILLSLLHYLILLARRQRGTDPTNTRFWGDSWLGRLPFLRHLRTSTIQSVVEPGLLLGGGYLFCAWAPLFGMFLMAGGLSVGLHALDVWHLTTEREFDARDAIVQAGAAKAAYDAAQRHAERERTRSTAPLARATLARIQEDPHELLRLGPDDVASAREELGEEGFGDLCSRLEPEARRRLAIPSTASR